LDVILAELIKREEIEVHNQIGGHILRNRSRLNLHYLSPYAAYHDKISKNVNMTKAMIWPHCQATP
jgi:hypothetical protein